MATTLTRNLKLRVNSNLTADAKYNLQRLDLLGSTFIVDTGNDLNIRSEADITIEPESADIGGSGVGGTVTLGNASHDLSAVTIYSSSFSLNNPISLLDKATGGDKYLRLQYKSDLSGVVDTLGNRTLSLDLEGADRSLTLGGDLSTVGANLSLTLTGDSSLTMPTSGILATLAGLETLTNKTINAPANNITNLANANIASSAAIAYTKLSLADSILNSDIASSANIAYSKLNLTGSIDNDDIASGASILYSKLNLTNSLTNSDIATSAAIAYSKLNLSASIQNSDLSGSFALAGSQVDPTFGAQAISTSEYLRFVETHNTDIRAAQAGQTDSIIFTLPPDVGNNNQVLTTDGLGNLSWTTAAGSGTVVSYAEDWIAADGSTKTVTHNLGSTDIDVTLIDLDDNTMLFAGEIEVVDTNTITLTSSESPANSWRVIIQA